MSTDFKCKYISVYYWLIDLSRYAVINSTVNILNEHIWTVNVTSSKLLWNLPRNFRSFYGVTHRLNFRFSPLTYFISIFQLTCISIVLSLFLLSNYSSPELFHLLIFFSQTLTLSLPKPVSPPFFTTNILLPLNNDWGFLLVLPGLLNQ